MLSRKSLEGGRFAGFVDSGTSAVEDIDAESVDPVNRRGLGRGVGADGVVWRGLTVACLCVLGV